MSNAKTAKALAAAAVAAHGRPDRLSGQCGHPHNQHSTRVRAQAGERKTGHRRPVQLGRERR